MSGLLGLSNQARLLKVWGVLPSYFFWSAISKRPVRKKLAAEQGHAAIDAQNLSVDETCRVRGQERDRIGDLLRLGVTLERYAFHLAGIGGAGGEKARRGGGARADRVHAHAIGLHLQRQAARVMQDG